MNITVSSLHGRPFNFFSHEKLLALQSIGGRISLDDIVKDGEEGRERTEGVNEEKVALSKTRRDSKKTMS